MIARCITPKQLPNYLANCNLKLTKQFLVSNRNYGSATPTVDAISVLDKLKW